jgi:ribosomal protein S18 acetylase RimI-like enzyme
LGYLLTCNSTYLYVPSEQFGTLRGKKGKRDLEIVGLAVRENQRRRGYASQLLKHAEVFSHEQESMRLIVRTSNDNIPALALYQERGFVISRIKLGSIIAHHGGKEIPGWRNIPVRDEVILEKLTQ